MAGMQPILIRKLVSQRRLDLIVFDNAVLNSVDQEHASGLQATLANNAGWVNRQHSGFTGQDHEPIVGNPEATRTQPIAVKDCPDN